MTNKNRQAERIKSKILLGFGFALIAVLVAGGYAKEGIGRFVRVTAKGQQYLGTHPIRRG